MNDVKYAIIPKFPNYKVASDGTVYKIYLGGLKPLKGSINNNGFRTVTLRYNDRFKIISVSHLVAKLFLPNPNNYHFVKHLDGNILNNNVENLQWCYNNRSKTKVKCVDTGEIFDSVKDVANKYLTTNDYITDSIRNDRVCFGHRFTYVD